MVPPHEPLEPEEPVESAGRPGDADDAADDGPTFVDAGPGDPTFVDAGPDDPTLVDAPSDPTQADAAPGAPIPADVPEELSVLPPGPLLAEILDELPVQSVSGYDCVEVMAAAYRQLCRQQAVFFEALLETGLRAPGSASAVARLSAPGEFAHEEARAKLVWSRQRSQTAYVLAFDLFVRYPVLGAALRRAELDLPRARAFIDWTEGLTDTQAASVIDRLLPDAAGLVVGALIDRIQRACLAIDPDWAAKKYRAAVKTRRVRGYRNPDGTATLAGHTQPVDRVAAACHRIDQLARACKRAGDKRAIDLIRSDLYLRMLDGSFEAMTDTEIITHVLDHPLNDHTDTPDPTDDHHEPVDTHTDGHIEDGGGDDDRHEDGAGGGPDGDDGDGGDGGSGRGGHGGVPGGGSGGRAGHGGDGGPTRNDQPSSADPTMDADNDPDHGPARPGFGGHDADRSGDEACRGGHGRGDDGSARGDQTPTTRRGTGAAGPVGRRWAVPELRVRLSTMLDHDQCPAEIPGWDHVPAWLARQLIADMNSAEWRYVICGPDGRVITGGLLASRPHTPAGPAGRDHRRGGIVEIAATTTELTQLATTPAGPWTPILTELIRHHSDPDPDPTRTGTGTGTDQPGQQPTEHDPAGPGNPGRVAGARLRRWIQLRDRQCVHPTCRAPAAGTDQDHRTGYAAGGPTTAANLDSACRHDHRLKDDGGWTVHRPTPDTLVWASPLGHQHPSRPPPVIVDLPPPSPDPDGHHQLPDTWYDWTSHTRTCGCDAPCDCPTPILPPPPARVPKPQPPPPQPAPTFDPNDIPPF